MNDLWLSGDTSTVSLTYFVSRRGVPSHKTGSHNWYRAQHTMVTARYVFNKWVRGAGQLPLSLAPLPSSLITSNAYFQYFLFVCFWCGLFFFDFLGVGFCFVLFSCLSIQFSLWMCDVANPTAWGQWIIPETFCGRFSQLLTQNCWSSTFLETLSWEKPSENTAQCRGDLWIPIHWQLQ